MKISALKNRGRVPKYPMLAYNPITNQTYVLYDEAVLRSKGGYTLNAVCLSDGRKVSIVLGASITVVDTVTLTQEYE